MRRFFKILAWVLAVPLVLILLVVLGLETGIGQNALRAAIVKFAGVQIGRIDGSPLRHTTVSDIALTDANGTWLTVQQVELRWSPFALLSRRVQVDLLAVTAPNVIRAPVSEAAATPPEPAAPSSGPLLPVHVRIADLRIDNAQLGEAIAGLPITLNGSGQATLARDLRGGGAFSFATLTPAGGSYEITWDYAERIEAKITVAEPDGGVIARLAQLPALGALRVDAASTGPADGADVNARITLASGLEATIAGRLDAIGATSDLRINAAIGRATLSTLLAGAAEVGNVTADLHVTGKLTDPDATATLAIADAGAQGAAVARTDIALNTSVGAAGRSIAARVTAQGIALPAPMPAPPAEPARLDAALLLEPSGILRIDSATLRHPWVSADATGALNPDGTRTATASISVPDLKPFAAASGMAGALNATAHLTADGTIALDARLRDVTGPGPVAGLLAPESHLQARLNPGDTLRIEMLKLDGPAVHLDAAGQVGDALDLRATLDLPRLAVLAPQLEGNARAQITASGRTADPGAVVQIDIPQLAVANLGRGHLTLHADAKTLVSAPDLNLTGTGELAGEPITAAVRVLPQPGGAIQLPPARLAWGSTQLAAEGTLLADGRPDLTASLNVPNLERIGMLIGQALHGAIEAHATLRPSGEAVNAEAVLTATRITAPGARAERVHLTATATDALRAPVLNATLDLAGITAGGTTTGGQITARGGLDALDIQAALSGTDHALNTHARYSTPSQLRIATLTGRWKGETATLAAPATLNFDNGVDIDKLTLRLRDGSIEASGHAGDTLDLRLAIRRLPLALAAIAAPDLQLSGTLEADATIRGTPAAPDGTARITARSVRLPNTPVMDAETDIRLAGGNANVDARLRSGSRMQLRAVAQTPISAPMRTQGTLDGTVDLALLDPILSADGRRARGTVRVALRAQGTDLSGDVSLNNASFEDMGMGVRVAGITGRVRGSGEQLTFDINARSGGGQLALTGTAQPLQPEVPVDLRIVAQNTGIAVGEMLTARFNADIRAAGAALGTLPVTGNVTVLHADIRLPDQIPASVTELPVRTVGERRAAARPATGRPAAGRNRPPSPQPAPATSSVVQLNIAIDAPRAVFIRGMGLDAEMGGNLRVQGTAAAPVMSGQLDMRRGTLAKFSQTFDFRRGKIDFDGAEGLVPSLDFEAATLTDDITGLIRVGGLATAPKITITSEPEMPSDEVLSRILFGRATSTLTPLQAVQLAQAAAELAGVGGGGPGIVDRVRQGLGLDRLNVDGGDGAGRAPSVEAGRYVADGVYLGARQSNTGTPQATIQIEVLPGVKLEADLGAEEGSRVGASWGFDY